MSDDPDPFKSLGERLAKARQPAGRRREGDEAGGRGSMAGFSMAFRIGVELVAALIVGVGAGLLLDKWLETAPLFLVVFFFLGAAAGVLNVYRAASGLAGGMRKSGEPGEDDLGPHA